MDSVNTFLVCSFLLLSWIICLFSVVNGAFNLSLACFVPLTCSQHDVQMTLDSAQTKSRAILAQYADEYSLNLYLHDSCTQSYSSVNRVVSSLSSHTYEGVVGPGNPALCETAALMSEQHGKPLVSYSCLHHILDASEVYPAEARTLPSINVTAESFAQQLKLFKWERVELFFSSDDNVWVSIAFHLELVLEAHGFIVQRRHHMTENTSEKEFEKLQQNTKG